MAICEVTGKRPAVKNLVSHSNIKTKRPANPNVQSKRLFSERLGRLVSLKISTAALRTIEHVGGLDRYLARVDEKVLSPRALKVRREILNVKKGKALAAAK